MYGTPFNAGMVLAVNPWQWTLWGLGASVVAEGSHKWAGITALRVRLYAPPCNVKYVLMLDPGLNKVWALGSLAVVSEGDHKWCSVAALGTQLHAAPWFAEMALVVDPGTRKAWGLGSSDVAAGAAKWDGVVALGASLLAAPAFSELLMVVMPALPRLDEVAKAPLTKVCPGGLAVRFERMVV